MSTSLTRGHAASLHEHALLRAAQHGDRRAQEELVRRYEPLVRHTVRRLRLPCHADRDDIAQEARLGLLRAIRAWQPAHGPFPAFAAQCVHTKTANALSATRALKHQLLSTAKSLDWAPSSDQRQAFFPEAVPSRVSMYYALLVAPGADPASAVLMREQLDAVRAAWPTLSEKERVALAGVVSGRSYRDLAVELACTPKAVERAVRRARRKLTAKQVLAA